MDHCCILHLNLTREMERNEHEAAKYFDIDMNITLPSLHTQKK